MRRACERCEWWVGEEGLWGECRVRPPIAGVPDPDRWPFTRRHEWCAAFKENNEKTRARHAAIEDGHVENYDRALDKTKKGVLG